MQRKIADGILIFASACPDLFFGQRFEADLNAIGKLSQLIHRELQEQTLNTHKTRLHRLHADCRSGCSNPAQRITQRSAEAVELHLHHVAILQLNSRAEAKRIRTMALAAFRACDCAGLARVDFLMSPGRKGQPAAIYLNEVNTMPGFTSISMYPKLWAASGLAYPRLIDRLIELALERHCEKQETQFTR